MSEKKQDNQEEQVEMEKKEELMDDKPDNVERTEESLQKDEESKLEEISIETASENNSIEEKTAEPEKDSQEKNSISDMEPYIDPSIDQSNQRRKKRRKIGCIVAAVFVLIYIGGVIFHMNCFGTMTTINGIDVTGKTAQKADQLLLEQASSYVLNVKFKNEDFTISPEDVDAEIQLKQSTKTFLKKNSPFLWFVNSFCRYDYKIEYIVVCDRDKLKQFMNHCESLDKNNMEASIDAEVIFQDGEAVIVPEQTGTELDIEKVYDKILYAMENYEETLDVEKAECYIPAHITQDSDSVLQTKEVAEDFLSIEAEYDFGDYTYRIPKEDLADMAYIREDGTVQVSRYRVSLFVDKFMKRFSTANTDRKFKTHDGKTILVHGGYYGWVLDPDAETEELYNLLCEKKSFTKEPAYKRHGYTMCEENDIGYTYVEVDLTNQHVYFYQNGKLKWDSDCVTGQTPWHKTPGGLYGVTYKTLHATLKGDGYESKVTYWMPFNQGIGLHDATWRDEFGGDIYTYDGSHGCVNLPLDKAGELFDYIEPGMPVVCYWQDEAEEVKE